MLKILVALLLMNSIVFPSTKIINKLYLAVTIDKKELSKIYHIDPPVRIFNGIGNEIIVAKYTFFEVFDENGMLIKKVGDAGRGPGDFINIMGIIAKNGFYYIHDYPDIVSIFNKKFKFIKKIRFGGPGVSQYTQSMDIDENSIYFSQNVYSNKGNKVKKIVNYSFDGEIRKFFFNIKFGEKVYTLRDLLSGRIKVFNNKIIFSFFSVPKIWILEKNGNLLDSFEFGNKWWKKIKYNKRNLKKREREIGSDRARAELLLSGDRIIKLLEWRGNLLVHIIKDPAEDYAKHGFVLFGQDLEQKTKFVSLKDYQFSGVGKYIYFSRELEDNDLKNKMKIEVLKCDLDY